MTTNTYELIDYQYERFETLLASLNRKAEKLELTPITCTILNQGWKEVTVNHDPYLPGTKEKFYFYTVEVTGEAPRLNGWSFLAKIEHSEEGNFIYSYGETLPKTYWTAPPICEHCHQERNRTVTYVLQNEKGEYKQVGSTCLKDFTGALDPHRKAAFLEGLYSLLSGEAFADDLDDDFYKGARRAHFIHWKPVLSNALAVIDKYGYQNRDSDFPTKEAVYQNIFPFNPTETILVTADHLIKASQIYEWALHNLDNPETDYEWNLSMIVNTEDGYFNLKYLGLAVSLVPYYNRKIQQELEKNTVKDSEYQGEVGDKITFSGTITRIIPLESGWGISYLHIFQDDKGNAYSWFASNGNQPGNQGDQVKVTGKVKKHEDYRGIKQTVLTRCKIEVLK